MKIRTWPRPAPGSCHIDDDGRRCTEPAEFEVKFVWSVQPSTRICGEHLTRERAEHPGDIEWMRSIQREARAES